MGDTKAPDCKYSLVQAASRLTTRATCLSKVQSSEFCTNVSLLESYVEDAEESARLGAYVCFSVS